MKTTVTVGEGESSDILKIVVTVESEPEDAWMPEELGEHAAKAYRAAQETLHPLHRAGGIIEAE